MVDKCPIIWLVLEHLKRHAAQPGSLWKMDSTEAVNSGTGNVDLETGSPADQNPQPKTSNKKILMISISVLASVFVFFTFHLFTDLNEKASIPVKVSTKTKEPGIMFDRDPTKTRTIATVRPPLSPIIKSVLITGLSLFCVTLLSMIVYCILKRFVFDVPQEQAADPIIEPEPQPAPQPEPEPEPPQEPTILERFLSADKWVHAALLISGILFLLTMFLYARYGYSNAFKSDNSIRGQVDDYEVETVRAMKTVSVVLSVVSGLSAILGLWGLGLVSTVLPAVMFGFGWKTCIWLWFAVSLWLLQPVMPFFRSYRWGSLIMGMIIGSLLLFLAGTGFGLSAAVAAAVILASHLVMIILFENCVDFWIIPLRVGVCAIAVFLVYQGRTYSLFFAISLYLGVIWSLPNKKDAEN